MSGDTSQDAEGRTPEPEGTPDVTLTEEVV